MEHGGSTTTRQLSNSPSGDLGRWTQLLAIRDTVGAKVVLAILVVGVLFDLAVRSSDVGLATALLFVGAAGALAVIIWPRRNRAALITLALIPLFSAWLVVRASYWLIPLDIIAVLLLLCVAASFASGGNPLRITVPGAVLRAVVLFLHTFFVIPFVTQPLQRLLGNRGGKWMPVVRGLLIAAPVFLVLLFLLMSADAVFASIFDFDLKFGSAINHLLIIAIGVWLFATLARTAMSANVPNPQEQKFKIGATEGLIAVGSLVFLFGAFALSQLITWAGGANSVLETAGLTYAQYARNGFFQLLAVAVITLGVLMVVKSTTNLTSEAHRRWFKILGLAAVGLILVIVAVALRRLALYEDAYGLTMLRLFSTVFAVWTAVVFVMFGVVLAEVKRGNWFVGAGTSVALAFLFAMNVMNPEVFVVNRNFDRTASAEAVPFDTYYVVGLSSDAVPTVLDRIDELPEQEQTTIRNNLCPTADVVTASPAWTAWNLSEDRAISAREAC